MSVATASPSGVTVTGPGKPLTYSELTPDLILALRILAALETTYPQNGTRASQTLAGHAEWSRKRHLRPNVTNPG